MRNEIELKNLLGEAGDPILERNTMGMLVQISHHKEKDVVLLEVQNGKQYGIAEIEPDKIFEAFYHPLDGRFIPNPNSIFPKSKSL